MLFSLPSEHKVLIRDDVNASWLSFSRPRHIYCLQNREDITTTLARIEKHVREENLWAAGWLSYEAASEFDSALITHAPTDFPVMWFGLFEHCETVCVESMLTKKHVDIFKQTVWSLNSDLDKYAEKIGQIKDEIRNGNTYQVNYTIRQFADLDISANDAFLGFASNARYGAFIDSGRFAVCCASPELFFEIEGDTISSRPMKGTAPRGRFTEEDQRIKRQLYDSEKDRAENLMIVDMIRNDIGRIAVTGSVKVPKLFEVEKYPTVWQMTSTVTAKLDASLTEIFQALFPCASITGAPKANTMRIINRLEPSARNIYTGTIGFIRPDMSMQFNVAIRTVLIDKHYNQAEYGVGGGIVWDSTAQSEYQECLTKSRVLSGKGTYTHQLLETLLWTPEQGFFLLEYHLNRLQQSAEYFEFNADSSQIIAKLEQAVEAQTGAKKVRLLIAKQGHIQVQVVDLAQPTSSQPYRLKLAEQPIDSRDVYLFHKTTQRHVYESFSQLYPDYDDVLLINEKGEVTESCIANLVVEIDGLNYTPPVESGLLNGTYRQYLIDNKQLIEKTIDKKMLKAASQISLINSVRKSWPVVIEY